MKEAPWLYCSNIYPIVFNAFLGPWDYNADDSISIKNKNYIISECIIGVRILVPIVLNIPSNTKLEYWIKAEQYM